ERYQTVADFAADLKRLQRQMGSEAEQAAQARLTLSLAPPPGAEPQAVINKNGAGSFQHVKSQLASSAEYLLSEIKKRPGAAIFTGVAAILALLFVRPPWPGLRPPPLAPFQQTKITPLTNSGPAAGSAISPDA